jgi:hypothetical protein
MKPTGKKEILKADLVLLAMGFLRPVQPEFPANVFVNAMNPFYPDIVIIARTGR